MSRRGVSAAVGKPESTIRGWIERGLAFPDVEPWGSFAVDYQRAERGLEGAGASTVTWVVARLHRLTLQVDRGEREGASEHDRGLAAQALEALIAMPQLKELLSVLAARFPKDWGTSKHREPEPEYSGSNWLDANAMDREQLGAVFADPPEPIRLALQDRAPEVYRILLEGGFDPAAPVMRKAEDDETEESEGHDLEARGSEHEPEPEG